MSAAQSPPNDDDNRNTDVNGADDDDDDDSDEASADDDDNDADGNASADSQGPRHQASLTTGNDVDMNGDGSSARLKRKRSFDDFFPLINDDDVVHEGPPPLEAPTLIDDDNDAGVADYPHNRNASPPATEDLIDLTDDTQTADLPPPPPAPQVPLQYQSNQHPPPLPSNHASQATPPPSNLLLPTKGGLYRPRAATNDPKDRELRRRQQGDRDTAHFNTVDLVEDSDEDENTDIKYGTIVAFINKYRESGVQVKPRQRLYLNRQGPNDPILVDDSDDQCVGYLPKEASKAIWHPLQSGLCHVETYAHDVYPMLATVRIDVWGLPRMKSIVDQIIRATPNVTYVTAGQRMPDTASLIHPNFIASQPGQMMYNGSQGGLRRGSTVDGHDGGTLVKRTRRTCWTWIADGFQQCAAAYDRSARSTRSVTNRC